jgi:hypothetical protein
MSVGAARTPVAMGPEAVLARQRAYAILAAFLFASNALVLALAREGLPSREAMIGLTLEGLALAVASITMRFPQVGAVLVFRGALVVSVSILAALPGWFFGTNGPFAGFIAIILLGAGVIAEPGRRALIGVSVYVALASSQAAVTALVLTGVLEDRSLVPLFLPNHPVFHHAVGHVAIQLIYATAFLSGHVLGRRYAAVVRTIEDAQQKTAWKEALLDEARAEYRRAVRSGRDQTAPAPRTSEPPPPANAEDTEVQRRGAKRPLVVREPEAPRASVPPSVPPPPLESERGDAWEDAYRLRKRGQDALIFALAILGSALLGVVGPGPVPVLVGCIGIVSVAILALVARAREELRAPAWAMIGVCAVAPAYAVGLHSGFVCVVSTLLFVGSAFEPAGARSSLVARYGVLAGAVVSHAIVFALIARGIAPDAGNSPVLSPGHTALEPYLLHLSVQSLFFLAFALGRAVDRRHLELLREAERARTQAARRDAQLRAADADVARALESDDTGLFTGQVVGPYRLGRVIASGGMGDIYEARPAGEDAGERVAVKLVRRERVGDPLTLALFDEEAAALARVSSPFVATVLGIGGHDSDLPYLAMELIEGSTLATILRERGHLSVEEVRALVRDVADGLRAVHAAGIIHRDVKPHNVMLTATREGTRWKIVDFGVAQLHELAVAGSSVLAGTAPYMAPEHALGERVDARADLYALALVAYRALAGRPAFLGEDRVAIAELARRAGPPDPRGGAPLSRELELVLRIGLAARAEDRFATAAELRGAFEAAFDGKLADRLRKRAEAFLAASPWAPS